MSAIGDSLHHLSPKQIRKLVALRFNGNPYELIDQMSRDLAAKESELVLLRREYLKRENELVRLCTEKGGASAMEIDQLLNKVAVKEDPAEVLSELVTLAIEEEAPKSEIRFSPRRKVPQTQIDLKPVELENMELVSSGLPLAAHDQFGFFNDVGKRLEPPHRERDARLAEATILKEKSMEKLRHLAELHDAKNEKIVRKWDEFMRKSDEEVSEARETFGFKGLNLSAELHETLQTLVRQRGIPPKFRNRLWLELSGAKNREVRGEYQRLLHVCRTATDPRIAAAVQQIELDLHRTLPSNKFFMDKGEPGPHFYVLRNVLYAFVALNPAVGYSQGMNKIVGNLLLGAHEGNGHYKLPEEDIFWIFVSLTEDFVPEYAQHYFDKASLGDIVTDLRIIQQTHLPQALPKLHEHLTSEKVETEVIMLGWWLGLFTEVFSVELWFKVVDWLLVAPHPTVVFYSLSVALFQLFEPVLLDLDGAQIYRMMNHLKEAYRNVHFEKLTVKEVGLADVRAHRRLHLQAGVT